MEKTTWILLLSAGLAAAANNLTEETDPVTDRPFLRPLYYEEYYTDCQINQVRITLVKPDFDLLFLKPIDAMIAKIVKLEDASLSALSQNLAVAKSNIMDYENKLFKPTAHSLPSNNTEDVTELDIDIFIQQLELSQRFPVKALLAVMPDPINNAQFLYNLTLLEIQLSQTMALVEAQINIYNNIVQGKFDVSYIISFLKARKTFNFATVQQASLDFIATLYVDQDVCVYANLILASKPKFAVRYLLLPIHPRRPQFESFIEIEGYGVEKCRTLPLCLLTSTVIFDPEELVTLKSGTPEQLKTIYSLKQKYDSFFISMPGSIVFYNDDSKIDYDFGKIEQTSPILLQFHRKIFHIGKSIARFLLNPKIMPEQFKDFKVQEFVRQTLNNIFSSESILQNLTPSEIVIITLTILSIIILGIMISLVSHQKRKRYVRNRARKQRETANLRSVNLILKNRNQEI